jgi:hypothetical protein
MTPETKQKIKDFALKTLPFLLLFLLGAWVGWGFKPEQVRVEEKWQIKEVEKQVVVTQEKVRVEVVKVYEKDTSKKTHTETVVTKAPDGTTTTKVVEDTSADSSTKNTQTSNTSKEVAKTDTVEVYKEETGSKVTEPVLPKWHVGALMGVQPSLVPLNFTTVFFGAEVEHRLAGPLWVGGIVSTTSTFTTGQIGIKLAVEF